MNFWASVTQDKGKRGNIGARGLAGIGNHLLIFSMCLLVVLESTLLAHKRGQYCGQGHFTSTCNLPFFNTMIIVMTNSSSLLWIKMYQGFMSPKRWLSCFKSCIQWHMPIIPSAQEVHRVEPRVWNKPW